MVYRNTLNNPLTAIKQCNGWINVSEFNDLSATPGQQYFYWVRASDNVDGSNTTGYSSGFSLPDTGWISETITIGNIELLSGDDTCFDAAQTLVVAGGTSWFIIQNGCSAELVAGQKIQLLPGIKVYQGGYLSAAITTNGQFCGYSLNTGLKELTSSFPISDQDHTLQNFRIHPNPTTGIVKIENSEPGLPGEVLFEIWSAAGKQVLKRFHRNFPEIVISLEGQASGVYFLRITTKERTGTFRIIKQ